MHPTAIINVVGLTVDMLGENTPHLNKLARDGSSRPLTTITPALTCSVQSTFVTGKLPSEHGIVGNGWYFRDLAQVLFWRQNDGIVKGEKVWETAQRRYPGATCAKMFWWYNMYASVDYAVTPRPAYPADGRKILDIYSEPEKLRDRLVSELGAFPFFNFWGPKSDIRSSEWIAAAGKAVQEWHRPSLNLIYLPHLDYNLQRLGPDDPAIGEDIRAIDNLCGEMIESFREQGVRVVVLSEYGITQVSGPVHINRVLREAGMIRVRDELGLEMLDTGASDAFAVADHQVAHIYVKDSNKVSEVKALLEKIPGVERVLEGADKAAIGLDHPRSGELVAISEADKWFTYYYWLDDAVAPDYARTVDIHRKPGYDPVELFVDPAIRFPPLKVASILLKKKLGFRYLMDVIPLDATLVKGSHGRVTDDPNQGPVLISSEKLPQYADSIAATEVKDLMLDHMFGE